MGPFSIDKNSRFLGAIYSDGMARIWRISDGSLAGQLTFPVQEVQYRALALSRDLTIDGRYLASASKDGTIRIWGVVP